jgi:hypothetical protein
MEYDIALPGERPLPVILYIRMGTDEVRGRLPKELLPPPDPVDEDEEQYDLFERAG